MPPPLDTDRVPTGTEGLDTVLSGGLYPGHAYLLLGEPGTGKTTLALQFAIEGARRGEPVLFVTVSQTADDLRQIARSHGWTLDGVEVEELGRGSDGPISGRQNALHPADVELGETVDALREALERVRPARLVIDSLGVLRLFAAGQGHRYHAEVAALVRLLGEHGATSLVIGPTLGGRGRGESLSVADAEVQTLVHGAIRFTREAPPYGALRRSLQVEKSRGADFHTGWHNFAIRTGGLEVFPRLDLVLGHEGPFQKPGDLAAGEWERMESGVGALDRMLGGGLEFGTSALVVGATGTGKSTLAMLYAHAALRQGRKAAVFLFTERPNTYVRRAASLSMDLRPFVEDGALHFQSVDVGELSPGAFADRLREVVDGGAEVVVIDSLSGYYHAMHDEGLLQVQMHDMLAFLADRGVLGVLVVDQHGLVGSSTIAPVDVSYLCDSLVVLRNYDEGGRIRRAIAVVKKRYGPHDLAVCEFEITDGGLEVGGPLEELIGVLSGNPEIMRRSGPTANGGGSETPS